MKNLLTLILAFCVLSVSAQKLEKQKDKVLAELDKRAEEYSDLSLKIWDLAEVGYQEYESSKLLQEKLKSAGFTIEAGVAEMPTAFIASYGSGAPVLGILAEFDALPGMAQKAVAHKETIEGQRAGHACGHHLFGTASVASGISIKEWMETNKIKGTIRVYGTPAEEGGSGKVYMVRAGLFDDVDAVLQWHPSSRNSAAAASSLANKTGKFRFYGVSAHAAGAPEQGRSALDAVEAMNFMANMMREHVTDRTRIHYVITRGGDAPNIVPNFAEVYYYIRHPEMEEVKNMWDRLVKIAEGAALGTGTTMDYEITGGVYNILTNETLARIMDKNLRKVGGYTMTEEESTFSAEIQKTLQKPLPISSTATINPFGVYGAMGGSTDVGDVSWTVPTAGMSSATWVPGTPAHSWQAVAAGGTSLGKKGMMMAAKTMAITGMEILLNQELIEKAKEELLKKRGSDYSYEAMIGDRKPALDYRN